MKSITRTNIVKNALLAAFVSLSFLAHAQEEEATKKKLSFSGSVDTYFKTNLSSTDSDLGGGFSQAPLTSFANETGFALGMANLIASYEGEKVGFVADLVFGPRGDDATGGYNLNQLYAYWNVGESTKLTMGRFNTFLGYEVIAPAANFNYSTSYLFSYGPFSHVGIKADFTLSEDSSLMLALMNVTDVNNNLTGSYSLGLQYGISGQFFNVYYDDGSGIGFEVDYTGGFDLTDDVFLGLNAAYQDNDGIGFYGAALYPQLATSDDFTIGLRGEYFKQLTDGGPVFGFPDATVFAVTLTGSYVIEDFIIKPELRLDSLSEDGFLDNDLAPTKSLSSFAIAAIYSF
jgi:hypothetical protein